MRNRVISGLLLSLLLSACSSGSSDPSPQATVDKIGSKKSTTRASCDYDFDAGGTSPLALPTPNVKASLFAKQYDASLVSAIQSSSGAETARFAKLAGVTFYKVADLDIDQYDCLFTGTLPDAPKPVLDYFRDAEKDVSGEGDGKSTLLGFYLDKERVAEISGTNSIGPVVTVKNDSERYTMVHEFFHHVFNLSKTVSGTQLQINLGASTQVVGKAADAYNATQTAANLEALARAFDTQSKDLVKVLKEYTLEEMSIEYELNDLYQRNKLQYVNYYSRLNGDFYTVSSAESAEARIQKNEKMIDAIDSEVKRLAVEGSDTSATALVIASTRKMFLDLKNEVRVYARSAQNRVDAFKDSHKFISFNQDFLTREANKHVSGECQHGHGVDGFLDGIEARAPKILLKAK